MCMCVCRFRFIVQSAKNESNAIESFVQSVSQSVSQQIRGERRNFTNDYYYYCYVHLSINRSIAKLEDEEVVYATAVVVEEEEGEDAMFSWLD